VAPRSDTAQPASLRCSGLFQRLPLRGDEHVNKCYRRAQIAMENSWFELVDCVLRPARPRLDDCICERELHRSARRLVAEERARAIANCVSRIEEARAAVFAADDGVIPSRMTELEREWRRVSRSDPDDGLMDLWARIAPLSWIDRKRWRDSDAPAKLDAAIALASGAPSVEAAESAVGSLRAALAAWGTPVGSAIRWRSFDADADCVTELLAAPLRAAREAIARRGPAPIIDERTQQLEAAVYEAARARFPERPLLAQALAHAASVDALLRAAAIDDRPNPVTPLRELWQAGYTLAAVDVSGVTLELPPLP
jgi:hypothetical protein